MKQVSIRPVWTIQDPDGPALPPRVIELMVAVAEHGSLLVAAQRLGLSYRHAWDLVRQGEQQFGVPLLNMERGKGSTLTALGARIVWADRRIRARLRPALESLASELAEELRETLCEVPTTLRVHASHGFAIERVVEALTRLEPGVSVSYTSSATAVAALREGECDVAGLHLPIGSMQERSLRYYGRWLEGLDLMLIDIAVRRQGLMVKAGNPKSLTELAHLARPDVRFINRQAGSGTRLLLEGLLRDDGVEPTRIAGFERGEYTHAAVAAFVASDMADVGFGLDPPARQFGLDFTPLVSERYFLLCRAPALERPALQSLLRVLRDPAFKGALQDLPGYDPGELGRVSRFDEAFDVRLLARRVGGP